MNLLIQGNSLNIPLVDQSANCCVTSPPYYGLRDYGVDGQIGLEQTPDEYVAKLVDVFREVKRVLRDDGTLWLNLGDSYASNGVTAQTDEATGWKHGPLENEKRSRARGAGNGIKPKDLIGIPWRVAFALQADGWYLRSDIIWHKPNPMPESVKDRPTKAHEYIFLLSKNARYYYDYEAILEIATGYDGRKDTKFKGSIKYNTDTLARVGGERWPNKIRNYKTKDGDNGQTPQHHGSDIPTEKPARNKRSVWTVTTKPYKGAHYATFPPNLIEPCILAGCPEGGIILDPFVGSGTTVMVANRNNRKGIGMDLSWKYLLENAKIRIDKEK